MHHSQKLVKNPSDETIDIVETTSYANKWTHTQDRQHKNKTQCIRHCLMVSTAQEHTMSGNESHFQSNFS